VPRPCSPRSATTGSCRVITSLPRAPHQPVGPRGLPAGARPRLRACPRDSHPRPCLVSRALDLLAEARGVRPDQASAVSSPFARRPGGRADRQRGVCRGASEADGAGAATVTRIGRLWPARTRKRPRKAPTVVRRARRPAPIRFAMPRRAPRVRALPAATRGATTRGPSTTRGPGTVERGR
jgi:hypothetical protein